MALSQPSGSGVAFFAVPIGPHDVTLRDANDTVIDSRQVTVVQDDATEVTFVLDRQMPTATSTPAQPTATATATSSPALPTATAPKPTPTSAVTGLPSTGQGPDGGSTVPLLLIGAAALALLMGGIVRGQRRRWRG